MPITCPKCASDQARSLSLIHREGLTTTQGYTSGSAIGNMGGGFGVASTSGTINARSQTALSREAAPPAKHRFVVWVIVAVLAGLYVLTTLSDFGTGTLLMLGATAGSIVMARRARHFNLREHPGLMSNWEKSFMCNRCGQVFVS